MIWSSEGTRLATLRGHTLAVTCVDWRHTALGELLVTCADDKQLHVWQESAVVLEGASDPDGSGTWELRAALSTAEVRFVFLKFTFFYLVKGSGVAYCHVLSIGTRW